MTPLDESQLGQARELLQIIRGPEDIARELTQLAQNGNIKKSQIPGIASALQETVVALQAILKPETGEASLALEWAKTIRDNGIALMHGKLHPYWFDNSEAPTKLPSEPGYKNHGFIGISAPTKEEGESPNGEVNTKIQQFAQMERSHYDIEFLVVSPPVNPQHQPNNELLSAMNKVTFNEGLNSHSITADMKKESKLTSLAQYCQTTLSGKFTQPMREISYMFWASPKQLIDDEGQPRLSWRGESSQNSNDRPLQVQLNIFLSQEIADNLVNEMKDNPTELSKLIPILYPKTQGTYPLTRVDGNKLSIIEPKDIVGENTLALMRIAPQKSLK